MKENNMLNIVLVSFFYFFAWLGRFASATQKNKKAPPIHFRCG